MSLEHLKSFRAVFTAFYFASIFRYHSVSSISCSFYVASPIKDNCGGCGFCNPQTLDCQWLLESFLPVVPWQYARSQCSLKQFCATGYELCPHLCLSMFSSFRCICDPTGFGRLCEHSLPNNLPPSSVAAIDDVIFPPIFYSENFVTISVFISNTGEDMLIKYKSRLEQIFVGPGRCQYTDLAAYCRLWHSDIVSGLCKNDVRNSIRNQPSCIIRIQVWFPGLSYYSYNKDEEIRDVDGDLVAIKETFQIEIYNHYSTYRLIPYTRNYAMIKVLASPNKHQCAPKVYIRNIGENFDNRLLLTTVNEITISSSYELPTLTACRNVGNIGRHWSVWEIVRDHNDFKKPIKEVYMDDSLFFGSFSLKPGYYKVRLNLTVWLGKKEIYDYTYGFFGITEAALIPIIAGGTERKMYYDIPSVTLDGSKSKNLNEKTSEKGKGLKYLWKCDQDHPQCQERYSEGSTITYVGPFQKDTYYTFTLTVSLEPERAGIPLIGTTSQKILMSGTPILVIEIFCLRNCNFETSNPNEKLIFEAIYRHNPEGIVLNKKFKWTYKKGDGKDALSVDSFRQNQTPANVLIIPGKTLEAGEAYTFQVEGGADNPGIAEYKVVMAATPGSINCQVISDTEEEIYRGVTPVSISCDRLPDVLSPIYTMYNKLSEVEADEEARIISSGKSNVVHNVILTRDYFKAKLTNENGLSSSVVIKLDLLESENSITGHLNELQGLLRTSDAVQRANKIAVIVDLIAEGQHVENDISQTFEDFLKISADDEIDGLPFLKVWASSTYQIIKEGQKREALTMKSMNYLSKALTNLSIRLLRETKLVTYDLLTQGLTNDEIILYSSKFLTLANTIYDQTDEDFRKKNVEKEKMYLLYSSYRESTDYLMQAMEMVTRSLILNVSPYDLPLTIHEDKMFIWIKEDTPEKLSELSENKESSDSIPSVIISKSLAKSVSRQLELSNSSNMLVVRLVQFEGDPYWWDQKVQISTNVVDFKMVTKQERETSEINDIQYPIQINLENSFQEVTSISGTVEQANASLSQDELDLKVNIHQLRVPQTGRLQITFNSLDIGEELRVLAMFNLRPDYQILLKRGFTINSSSKVYFSPLKDPNTFDIYDLYYLGVIPGPTVPVGTVINYVFELSSSHCSSRTLNEWTTRGCRVVKTSEGDNLDCECDHLSIFGGFSQIPMNKVNPLKDYTLFVELPNNPYVFIFIISLLLLYLFLLVWTARKDYEDRKKEGAIYLEDNFPYDEYPYLVAVYTGNKLFSGTSANVGIAVEGSEYSSRHHVLRSSMFKTLGSGDDDWFLLFSPNYLGSLKLIHLWSDYSGWGPEWYCSKIIIVDLLDRKEYKFNVEYWLSLKRGLYIERYVDVCPPEEDQRLNVTIDNLIFGFRETHLWVSVMSRHPRSTVSRAQRLTVAFGGLLITMLVSCMFYGVLDEKIEDHPEYTVTSREIVIGFISVIITALLINLLVSVFRRSFVFKITDEAEIEEDASDEDKEEKTTQMSMEKNKVSDKKEAPKKETKRITVYRFFEDILKALATKKRFVPVEFNMEIRGQTLPRSYQFRRLWSCVSWFISVSMILICSYMINLYALKFGKVKSLQWLTSISFGFLHMFFIATPMKIIALSAMSGVLASNLYEVVTYRISYDSLIAYRDWYLEKNPDLEARLIALRKQRVYLPLPYLEVMRKMSRERKKEAVYTMIEMVLIAAVLALTFAELETLWTTKHYWNNHQLSKLLREGYEEEGLQLRMVRNISHYPSFLRTDVFPVIYRTSWYNGQPFVKEDTTNFRFVFSGTSKLVGVPRLRQLRIKPGLCKRNRFRNLTDLCLVTLSTRTEDNDFYGEGWITSGRADKFRASPVWSYMNDSETVELTLFGYTNAAYKAGGYVSDLAMSQGDSDDIIRYLERENWLDKRTKAIIFEFSIYSAFSGTLSWLISITENLHIGMLTNVLYVYSVSQDYGFLPLDIVFLASLLMFTFRVMLNMNRHGVTVLFCDFWTVFEMLLVILGIVCVVLLSKNILAIDEYFKEYFAGDTRDKYFQFLHLVSYLLELRIVSIFLILFIVCRFMKSWIYGKRSIPFYKTLLFCWNSLFWIFLVFVLTLFSYWRIFSYLLNSFMLVKNNFVLISRIDFKLIVNNCYSITCKINPYVLCSISSAVPLVIVMHFTHLYKIIKRKSQEGQEDDNICSVFCKKNTNTLFDDRKKRNRNILKIT